MPDFYQLNEIIEKSYKLVSPDSKIFAYDEYNFYKNNFLYIIIFIICNIFFFFNIKLKFKIINFFRNFFFDKKKLKKTVEEDILQYLKRNKIKVIFFFNFFSFSPDFKNRILKIDSSINFVAYLWDPIFRIHYKKEYLKYFRSILSFEQTLDPNIFYYPMIFQHEKFTKYKINKNRLLYQNVFIGTLNLKRLLLLIKINKKKENNFFYLASKRIPFSFKFFNIAISNKYLEKDVINKIYLNSKFGLEITNDRQYGISSRIYDYLFHNMNIKINDKDIFYKNEYIGFLEYFNIRRTNNIQTFIESILPNKWAKNLILSLKL